MVVLVKVWACLLLQRGHERKIGFRMVVARKRRLREKKNAMGGGSRQGSRRQTN
jgi:hypothetical protein